MLFTSYACQTLAWLAALVAVPPSSPRAVWIEFQVTVDSSQLAVTRCASSGTEYEPVVWSWSKYSCSEAELIVVPVGMVPRPNLTTLRALPVVVVPTDSRQLPSKLDAASSEMIIASCDWVTVGWILIVGSITTGYLRCGSASQPRSARITRVVPSADSSWLTFGLHTEPYGELRSAVLSVMYGFGIHATAGPSPSARYSAIEPFGWRTGRSPARSSRNV